MTCCQDPGAVLPLVQSPQAICKTARFWEEGLAPDIPGIPQIPHLFIPGNLWPSVFSFPAADRMTVNVRLTASNALLLQCYKCQQCS